MEPVSPLRETGSFLFPKDDLCHRIKEELPMVELPINHGQLYDHRCLQ
jgi:hypothetical protein